MAWIKIDDQFRNHPKILAAGPLASWLYVCGLTYLARFPQCEVFTPALVEMLANLPDPLEAAQWLVDAGLWCDAAGGFLVADWLNCSIMPDKSTQEERKTREYKRWRIKVLADNAYTCQACGVSPSDIKWLDAHHILPWAAFPEKRFDRKNGTLLCKSCHKQLHREMRENGG